MTIIYVVHKWSQYLAHTTLSSKQTKFEISARKYGIYTFTVKMVVKSSCLILRDSIQKGGDNRATDALLRIHSSELTAIMMSSIHSTLMDKLIDCWKTESNL